MLSTHTPEVVVDTSILTEKQWLDYRRKGIGGSDAAVLFGASPWNSRRGLCYDKIGVKPLVEEDNWVAKSVGHLLEPLVAEIFQKKTGYKVYKDTNMYRHPDYPFMLVNLDQNEPFKVCEISGFGFKIADSIAKAAGYTPTCQPRIKAGIIFALEEAMMSGHLHLTVDDLTRNSCTLLSLETVEITAPQVSSALRELLTESKLKFETNRIYLPKAFAVRTHCA